jgi:hypothetical protein
MALFVAAALIAADHNAHSIHWLLIFLALEWSSATTR